MKSTMEVKTPPKKQPENSSDLDLEHRIRVRAYELFEARKRGDGHDVEDWLDAEAQLRADLESPTNTIAA